MSDGPMLETESVDRSFGDVRALSDVSVAFERGTVTALVGPNGSGKTTLLRVLAGLLAPTAGTVTYRGPPAPRRVGYLPQRPAFRPGFTARETLAFYAGLVDDDPDRLLEQVGLSAVADRRVGALSGGMVRLLGIAQALAGEPPVVALDEPASGLDPGMSRRVYDVLADLATADRTVLVCSHQLSMVEGTADRVAVLDRGELAGDAPTADLVDRHGSLGDAFDAVVCGERATVETATTGGDA